LTLDLWPNRLVDGGAVDHPHHGDPFL